MKIKQVIHTKIILIIPPETVRFLKKMSDSKFEFAWGVANWCRLGYKLSVVNITTDVV